MFNGDKSARVLWGLCALLVLAKLWMVSGHDLLGKYRLYDDFLFLELSQYLLNGDWLGPLNYRTLIKGQGYPLFIAASYWLGVPLLSAQQLLYVFSCVVTVIAIRGKVRSQVVLFLVFALLLFNPFTYYYPLTATLMRESVNNSFALLFLASMLGLWLRCYRSVATGLMWAVLLGFAFSMLWLTREEAVWTVPGMALFALLFVLPWKWNDDGGRLVYRSMLMLIPVCMCVLSITAVKNINADYYGAPVFIEVKSPEFVSAIGSLMNIREDDFKRGVIVGKRSQQAGFDVSPSFASLKPYIEKRSRKLPNIFYSWGLRSAVKDAGYYSDPADIKPALDMYARIGAEISAACDAGKIRCFDRAATLYPPLHPQHIELVPDVLLTLFNKVVGFREHNALSGEFNNQSDMGMLLTYDYVTGESAIRKSREFEQMRPQFATAMIERKEVMMTSIGKLYQWLMPVLFVFSFAVHLYLLIRCIRAPGNATVPLFGLVLFGSMFTILAILTYIQVTLFHVHRPITVLYPLLLLYVVTILPFAASGRRR